MVTATTATMSFTGLQSKRVYNVSAYISDVVAATVLFNSNGVAGTTSLNYCQFPEAVILTDVSILTGPTVATGFNYTTGGTVVPNSNLLIAANLTSIQNRNFPNIAFKQGSQIGAIQF